VEEKTMKRFPLVMALSFAMLCLFMVASCSKKSPADNSNSSTAATADAADTANQAAANSANSVTPTPKPNRPAPDFTVTARDLLKETQANEKKAEAKYAGKQIAVTGSVTMTDVSEAPINVHLSAGAPLEIVVGYFDDGEKESVVALKEGQKVTLQCEGGSVWIGLPDLKNCTIIKVESGQKIEFLAGRRACEQLEGPHLSRARPFLFSSTQVILIQFGWWWHGWWEMGLQLWIYSNGNWIKRKRMKWVTKDGKSYFEPYDVIYRSITYF
jgi:hypothetical protein